MKGIHLFVPMLHRHDAVGEHTRALRDRLLASGVPSRIYTELPDPTTSDETRHYLDYESASEVRRRAGLPVRHRLGDGRMVGGDDPSSW